MLPSTMINVYNMIGITHYARGELEQAIAAFTDAMKQAKRVLGSTSSSSRDNSRLVPCDASFRSQNQESRDKENASGSNDDLLFPSFAKDQENGALGQLFITKAFPANQCAVQEDELFIVASPSTLPKKVSSDQASEAATRILFNIALSQHRLGVEKGDTNSLHKALKLYNLGHSLITGQDTGCPAMLAAMVNNLGHIHHVLGNHDMASHCFQHLLTILMCDDINLEERLRDQLFSNVLPLILTKQGLAPAAWTNQLAGWLDLISIDDSIALSFSCLHSYPIKCKVTINLIVNTLFLGYLLTRLDARSFLSPWASHSTLVLS